ncbi:MAG: LON peptidase substrate-binding domain-containing protein [Alphaproteobacteria bacterium]
MSPFDIGYEDLPPTIPIFPLTGVLLLARGRLPLNVFEPRYLAMTADAMRSDRLIGMIQPQTPESGVLAPPVYRTGCAGRIVSFEETDDGRYLITLKGVCRFDVQTELETIRGYRRMQVDWTPYREDFTVEDSCIDRERLFAALTQYFTNEGIQADWEAIRETPDDKLVTALAMLCPFEPREKQALLETADLRERGQVLTALVEMAALGGESGEPTATQ